MLRPSSSSASPFSHQLLCPVDLPLLRRTVDYLVHLTIDVVNHGLDEPLPQRGRSTHWKHTYANFRHLVESVIFKAQVNGPMLLAASIYVSRSKPHIQIEKCKLAYERVFLGALVVATKYHNDRSLKNNHWSEATGLFSPRDISKIEREMLDVLGFDLRIEEHELVALDSYLKSHKPSTLDHSIQVISNLSLEDPHSGLTDSDSGSESDSFSSSGESSDPVTPTSPLYSFPCPPLFIPPKKTSVPGLG